MAVISVRMNTNEEKILKYLAEYFHEEKSALLKKSLYEMYEDIQDVKFIDKYIAENKKKKKEFISSEELFKNL